MRIRIIWAVPAVLALSLGGCKRDPYVSTSVVERVGSWKIDRQTDRVTNTAISLAVVDSMASNSNVAFPRLVSLRLSCFINNPVVSFLFEFKVGNDNGSFLGYRFDEKPGHETNAKFLASARTVVIEQAAEVSQFVSELATSNVLYIRIRSFNVGRTTAEFKVDGAEKAIASAYATCPVKPPEPQRVAGQSQRKRSQ